ncbi:hypothetical protein D3C87_145920 [compost metagenome]
MKIVVAGASGFVGKALLQKIQSQHHVIGLSRSKAQTNEKIEWRSCDLFSLLDAEKGLEGADIAIYLVHSMKPSANLSQGSFADFDLIVADNFLRAAKKANIKQIIYLGGLHPETGEETSLHLRSRQEVENLFQQSSIPSTILRAAVILGAEGSSFHIMVKLVERLPFMVCPAWTKTESQPIALRDVVECITFCIGNSATFNQVFDIGGPDSVSYLDMMIKIAELKGLHRRLLPVPLVSPQISTLWVCLITRAPRALVKPLIAGLLSPLYVDSKKTLTIPHHHFLSVNEALHEALTSYEPQKTPLAFHKSSSENYIVRSVQRLPLPPGLDAEGAAQAYLKFLPQLQPSLVRVDVQGNWIYFCARFTTLRLLVLEYAPQRSWPDRQLFYVRGGLLARKTLRGRLEFREVLSKKALIAAIHDFEPRMPWFIYRWTQALAHLFTMRQFGNYLIRKFPGIAKGSFNRP